MRERAAAGQATIEALGELYERRYHRFLRVAEAIVGEVELANDVVQEAFARALRGRFDFRGDGPLEAWLWRTVVNAARNARRDRPTPQQPLLPERQRLVLFLRYYADLEYRRIAEVLEIQPGTVGATLNQAHATLKRLLEEVPQ